MPPRRVFPIPTPAIPPPVTRHSRTASCSSDEGYSSSSSFSPSLSRPACRLQKEQTKGRSSPSNGNNSDWCRTYVDLDRQVKKHGGQMKLKDLQTKMSPLHNLRHGVSKDEQMLNLHYDFNSYLDDDILDLHYLTVPLAKAMLEERIEMIYGNDRLPKVLYVCTGAGNGSQIRGKCVIKERVWRYTEEYDIECAEMSNNPGVLILSL